MNPWIFENRIIIFWRILETVLNHLVNHILKQTCLIPNYAPAANLTKGCSIEQFVRATSDNNSTAHSSSAVCNRRLIDCYTAEGKSGKIVFFSRSSSKPSVVLTWRLGEGMPKPEAHGKKSLFSSLQFESALVVYVSKQGQPIKAAIVGLYWRRHGRRRVDRPHPPSLIRMHYQVELAKTDPGRWVYLQYLVVPNQKWPFCKMLCKPLDFEALVSLVSFCNPDRTASADWLKADWKVFKPEVSGFWGSTDGNLSGNT